MTLSDSKGCLVATGDQGFTEADIELIADLKLNRGYLNQLYAADDSTLPARFQYLEGARPWSNIEKVDIVLPCATQNEVNEQEAKDIIAAGAKYLAEGSNMGSTIEAINVYEADRVARKTEGLWYGPAKAANCGGVAVSGLEMAQNSQRVNWTSESGKGSVTLVTTHTEAWYLPPITVVVHGLGDQVVNQRASKSQQQQEADQTRKWRGGRETYWR